MIAAVFLSSGVNAYAAGRLKVVSTLSSYAAIVQTMGGERVEASYVAPPRFDPHFIEPKPSDVFKVKRADLFVHSGLDLEAWRDALLDAAARADVRRGGKRQLDLSEGIALLEVPDRKLSRAEGDIHLYGNPHYWLDPRNGALMAQAIAGKLSELDPTGEPVYRENLRAFLDRLSAQIDVWRGMLKPFHGRELAGYHNGWVYLMDFAGLRMELFLEPKPGIPPTPRHIQHVLSEIKARHISAVVLAGYNPEYAARALAEQSGAKVVILFQNAGEGPQAQDYISMLDYNVRQLVEALHG